MKASRVFLLLINAIMVVVCLTPIAASAQMDGDCSPCRRRFPVWGPAASFRLNGPRMRVVSRKFACQPQGQSVEIASHFPRSRHPRHFFSDDIGRLCRRGTRSSMEDDGWRREMDRNYESRFSVLLVWRESAHLPKMWLFPALTIPPKRARSAGATTEARPGPPTLF